MPLDSKNQGLFKHLLTFVFGHLSLPSGRIGFLSWSSLFCRRWSSFILTSGRVMFAEVRKNLFWSCFRHEISGHVVLDLIWSLLVWLFRICKIGCTNLSHPCSHYLPHTDDCMWALSLVFVSYFYSTFCFFLFFHLQILYFVLVTMWKMTAWMDGFITDDVLYFQ